LLPLTREPPQHLDFCTLRFCASRMEGRQAYLPKLIFQEKEVALYEQKGGEQMFMSAYIVEDTTINQVVTWLSSEVSVSHFILDQLERKYDIDLVSDMWDEKLAKAMFQLNCDAVNARYGEGEAGKFRPLNFTYQPELYFSLVQALKSLQCWLYQCSEGEIPTTKLYQFFREVENLIALKIVFSLPEYDKATWG
jgi:hypothetical protein